MVGFSRCYLILVVAFFLCRENQQGGGGTWGTVFLAGLEFNPIYPCILCHSPTYKGGAFFQALGITHIVDWVEEETIGQTVATTHIGICLPSCCSTRIAAYEVRDMRTSAQASKPSPE